MGYQPFTTGSLAVSALPVKQVLVDVRLVQPKLEAKLKQGRKASSTMIAEIRAQRATGASLHEIAKRLNIGHTTVFRHTKDMHPPEGGWKTGAHPSKFPREKVLRMRRAGFTYYEIAEDIGASFSGARRIVVGNDPTLGGRRRSPAWFVAHVSQVTGVPEDAIWGPNSPHTRRRFDSTAKARFIIFWLMARRQKISPSAIAKATGFNLNSVIAGVARADHAAKSADFKVSGPFLPVIQRFWSCEWASMPPASDKTSIGAEG